MSARFVAPPDAGFRRLNDSISFDWRLGPYDVQQSRAHVTMLAAQGIISESDRDALHGALGQVERELADGSFPFAAGDEDIHMAIERRVGELAGAVGGKLHTARSRNDQVATDVAMFVRAHAHEALAGAGALAGTLVELAERHLDWPMPGYTHLQRAQPVYLSHHLLAYVWMLVRDRARFGRVVEATGPLPLGAGALAGVNFDTDRPLVARELGFSGVAENSIDAVSNRDFVLDYLAAAATCATHLSRLGAEIVLWSSSEFGFCRMADAWASGSSIMPQKKNPDAAELLRAKAPRLTAHLVALHGVLHGLPLTYNKDMQEDKEPLFDAADTLETCLAAARGMLELDHVRLRADAGGGCRRAAGGDRRGGPARPPRAPVPRRPRRRRRPRPDRGRPGQVAVRADPRGAARRLAAARRRVLRAAARPGVARVEGLRGRHEPGAGARAVGAGAGGAGGVRPLCLRGRPERAVALKLTPDFYDRPVLEVAPDLIGCVLAHAGCAGVIVETEAYHHSEPACHAFVGVTPRTRTLFGPPGIAYVYRSYGIHALLNAVCEREGVGAAVLIRALEPLEGIDLMRSRRAVERIESLCSGPGKLTQALGVELAHNGSDLTRGPIVISPRPAARRDVAVSVDQRIGITKAAELPWRFSETGSRFVSRRPAGSGGSTRGLVGSRIPIADR